MKQFYLLFTISFILLSCDQSTNKKTDDTTKTKSAIKEDNKPPMILAVAPPKPNTIVNLLTASQTKKLGKYLKRSTVSELDSLLKKLQYVQTDSVLEQLYYEFKPLIAKMEKECVTEKTDAYELMESMSFLKDIFALRATCEAEGTAFMFTFELKDFQKLSKITEGDKDDRFFDLKAIAQGEYGGFYTDWLTFFERTWDYGGGVQVGDGRMFDFLSKSFQLQNETKLFAKDLAQLRKETLIDLNHTIYMNTQEKVQKEINKILKSNILSVTEKKQVKATFNRNQKNESDPPLQFNCQTENCDWGG